MTNIYFWGKIISPSFQSSQQTRQSPIRSLRTDQLVKNVQCGAQNAFLLTNNNEVYACGSNQEGQIGLSFNPHRYLEISRVFVPTKTKIVSISCGWHHTLILDQLGCVFSSGKGSEGGIGQGTKENSYGFKQIMTGVKKISAGLDHSLAIKGNKVFGWGNTEQGQLGMHSKKKFLSPQELNIYPCQEVFAGPKYSIFVTVKGVYGCGMNNNFQLGLGHEKDLHFPKNLNLPDQIVKIWGGNYCFAKNKHGQVYIWGTGAFGVFKFPTKIPLFEGCDHISLGLNFGIVSKNDRIYVWGCNNFGELGNQNTDMRDYAYESLKLSKLDLASFCCGGNFSIGISYGEINQKMKSEFQKDQINENFDESEDLRFGNNMMKQSSFSNSQYPFKVKENVNIFKESAKQRQKKNNNFEILSINRPAKSQFGKLGCVKSQHQKALSDHTVKKIMSIADLYKKRYSKKGNTNHSDKNQNDIESVVQQLSQLKVKIHQKSRKNQVLANQNTYLRYIIHQNLKGIPLYQNSQQDSEQDVLQSEKQNLSNIEKLRNKLRSQQRQFKTQKRDDRSFRKSVGKNTPIRISQGRMTESEQDQQDQTEQCQQHQTEYFGQKLQKLKGLLQQALRNNQNQNQESCITQNQ